MLFRSKHIARTAALAFLIDLSDDNYLEAFDILMDELRGFSSELADKPRVVLGTKTDLPETEGRLEELAKKLSTERVFGMSVFSGDGLDQVAKLFLGFVTESEMPEDRDPWTGAPK